MDRFWERPYGLRFAVGVEDTFVPQVSPGLRPLDEYELTGHYDRWREDLDLVGYTWWPLFSLLDWAHREGEKPPEDYLWHMGMYDLVPDGEGNFLRTETPVVGAFRAATERMSER